MRIAVVIVLGVALLLAVLLLLGANYLAAAVALPRGASLEEEMAWEQEHELWGAFDDYETKAYNVAGKDDYALHCLLVKNPEPASRGKYVIISHGFKANRYGAVKYVGCYMSLGYNCLIYDVRAHGSNAESVCTLGNAEAEDLRRLIADSYERYGEGIELGLHGESMGSSISLNVLKFQPRVAFVVADCGFDNLYDLLDTVYRGYHLGFMTPLVNGMIGLRFKFDMKDTSARDALRDNRVPICFIHGEDDTFISPENSRRLSETTKGYTEVHIVKGAAHAQSREVMGQEAYAGLIADFLKKSRAE